MTTELDRLVEFHTSSLEHLLPGHRVIITPVVERPERPPRKARLGINLAEVSYYATELPFADVFKCSRPSRQSGETVMCVDIGDHYPAGVYQCTYEGTGSLAWSGAASMLSGGPGHQQAVLVHPSNNGIRLKVTGSVSNIRLTMPGTGEMEVFRQGFLDRWDKFGVIRFMDWQRTNHSKLSKWSDRTTMDSETQGSDMGVALEHMTDLCNKTLSHPWFCIPHLADDEFVREFAKLVHSTLRSGLKVYVEHTNEAWNSHFSQSAYCTQQGLQLGLSTNPKEANALYHAQRTVEIDNIFKTILGEDRVTTVLGGQTVNTWLTRTMLDHVYRGKPVHEQVDALGVAPYLGAGSDPRKTVDDYLRELEANIPGAMSHVSAQIDELADLTSPVRLVGYEGGQGLVGQGEDKENQTVTDTLIATNNDPRMHDVYEKYLRAWDEASGGGLFMAFNSTRKHSKHGSWGALEYYDSDERGKYSALVDYLEGR